MPKKRGSQSSNYKSEKSVIEKTIIENLIGLQKVHADLAEKFSKLEKQMSGLLNLFEAAARSFSEHPAVQASEKDKEFLDKIDRLLDQNKTIAKGLTLIEGGMKERIYGTHQESQRPTQVQQGEEYWENSVRTPSSGKNLPKF